MKRFLGALAIAGLAVIAGGAVVTGGHPEWIAVHRTLAIALGLMMLPLVRAGTPGRIALILTAIEIVPGVPVLHACLAPVILALIVFLWGEPVMPAAARDSLSSFAIAIPPLLLLQIAMGAAYRHKVWGVMPHMGGAMIVTTTALILSVLLMQRRSDLKNPATIFMCVVLAQVTLGIASFVLRLLEIDKGVWFTLATAAHVTMGAATLASSVWLARRVNAAPL